jgi:hypothetical protein
MNRTAVVFTALVLLSSCGKKTRNTEPLVGWHQEEGWAGACFYPPAFEPLGPGDRKLARQDVLKSMMTQWRGERGDGISFDPEQVEKLETVLLGTPDLIESVSIDNLARCQEAMRSGESGLWARWLRDAPARLTEGHCRTAPLDYQLVDYLDIGVGWQIPAGVCYGDVIRIRGSSIDEYKIDDKGPWITAAGDPDRSALGTSLPCNFQGCLRGMLIARFIGDSGTEQIIPVGLETVFEPPEHGRIEVQINDDTWFDNTYRIVGRMQHHMSIEYQGQ